MGFWLALLLYAAVSQLALACGSRPPAATKLHGLRLARNATLWRSDEDEGLHPLLSRSLSVPELPDGGSRESPYIYAWPKTCSEPPAQPLYFCFDSERSATNLWRVLEKALGLWFAAMFDDEGNRISSLSIEPAPQCPKDEHGLIDPRKCICSHPGVKSDVLMLIDLTKHGDDAWNYGPNCFTAATTGYFYISSGEPDIPWRHWLRFCDYEPTIPFRNLRYATRSMAHELGHALGLLHEHQRSDRDEYIKFRCSSMRGWREARERVDNDEFGLFEQMGMKDASREKKMATVCATWFLAQYYLPGLHDFLRTDQLSAGHPGKEFYQRVSPSGSFGYNSIMIYDSSSGARYAGEAHYVIRRRSDDREIIMGGSETDPRLSLGDIVKIARLYPIDTEAGRATRNIGTDDELFKRGTPARNLTVRVGNSPPIPLLPPRRAT